MHGLIFSQLKKFVETNYDAQTWMKLRNDSGVKTLFYTPLKVYPDEEIVALVVTASKMTGIEVPDLLEAFGKFIVPDLADMYGGYIKPEWGLLDLLCNIEETIHSVVRLKNPGAEPAHIKTQRIDDNNIIMTYTSDKNLSAVGVGIIKGLAEIYKQNIDVVVENLNDKGHCDIKVKTI